MIKLLRRKLLQASVPIQKLMQKLHPPEPKVTIKEVQEFLYKLEPGDILLSREAWHFTNFFIPGFWSHAALFSGHDAIEAVGSGVQTQEVMLWFLRKHNFCILRPTGYVTPLEKRLIVKFAEDQIGYDYDYVFGDTKTEKSFYCSELVWKSWASIDNHDGNWTDIFTRRETWGSTTVTPQDFYNAVAKGKLKIIYEHRE